MTKQPARTLPELDPNQVRVLLTQLDYDKAEEVLRLRDRKVKPEDCKYLNADEVAYVLISML